MPRTGAQRRDDTNEGRADRRVGADRELTLEQIEALEPTRHNIERVYHYLWGRARSGDYRKREWAAGHALLQRALGE